MRLRTGLLILTIFGVSDAVSQEVAERPAAPPASAAAVVAHGATLFKAKCASCHDPAVDRAPPKTALARRFPDDIATALKSGVMQPMAVDLSDDDIKSNPAHLGADR